jgi:inosose dehydratase
MSVRLGISPIGWSNDDLPELGGDIPLDTWPRRDERGGF